MVTMTLTIADEVVDGKDAVRVRLGHDIDPKDANQPVTQAMRCATYLIECYKAHGDKERTEQLLSGMGKSTPVGEPETLLEGMTPVVPSD